MYIDKLDDIVNNRYIYQNEIDKLYFQNDMTYVDFKDLPRRTASDKIKHLILLKTRNVMDIKLDLLQWFITFLIIKNFW